MALNEGSTALPYETGILAYSQGYELEVPNVNLISPLDWTDGYMATVEYEGGAIIVTNNQGVVTTNYAQKNIVLEI
jgi:hypothetical protein